MLSLRALIGLPILFVIWANLHGSFLTGLVLLAAALAGRIAVVILGDARPRWQAAWRDPQCRRLMLTLALSAVAVGCGNPSGPAIYSDSLAVASHPNVRAMDEWQPLAFHLGSGGHWLYLFLLAVLVVTQLCSRQWFSVESLVFLLIFGIPPLLHQRMMIWWLMIAPWIAVRYWPLCRPMPWPIVPSTPSFRKTLLAAAVSSRCLLVDPVPVVA